MFGCVALILVSAVIIIEPDISGIFHKDSSVAETKKETQSEEKTASTTSTKEEKETKNNSSSKKDVKIVDSEKEKISEKDARKIAKKQFKELDEKVKAEDLEVQKIQRQGEDYYYISSENNTCEIKIATGQITRLNSVKIDQ